MSEAKQAFVDGLRAMATHLERSNFDDEYAFGDGFVFNVFTWQESDFRAAGRSLGGRREKVLEGGFAMQRVTFGPHRIDVNLPREKVCERVKVGERVVPAQEERVEEVFEWVCPEGFQA